MTSRALDARGLAARLTFGVLLAVGSWACAKKGMPSGGPPDVVAPRLASARPDSAAAGVPRSTALTLTFSEGMEPRSTAEAVSLAPRATFRQRRWSGRTLTLELADSLRANQTYTMFVGGGARDRHGVPMGTGKAVTFTTAGAFPQGRIGGRIEAKGFAAPGTYVWCYSGDAVPDSTAQDFEALALAAADGSFEILGLETPGTYRLWIFGDLNANRSFEPQADVLAAAETTLVLDPSNPAIEDLALVVRNPRAPGRVRGAVLDSLGDSLGVVRVIATSERDSTRRESDDAGEGLAFDLQLAAGPWRLIAYRDLDKNRHWDEALEPGSEPLLLEVVPADDVHDLVLVLRRTGVVRSPP